MPAEIARVGIDVHGAFEAMDSDEGKCARGTEQRGQDDGRGGGSEGAKRIEEDEKSLGHIGQQTAAKNSRQSELASEMRSRFAEDPQPRAESTQTLVPDDR